MFCWRWLAWKNSISALVRHVGTQCKVMQARGTLAVAPGSTPLPTIVTFGICDLVFHTVRYECSNECHAGCGSQKHANRNGWRGGCVACWRNCDWCAHRAPHPRCTRTLLPVCANCATCLYASGRRLHNHRWQRTTSMTSHHMELGTQARGACRTQET